ncbi:hypothetical protein E1A91_D05G398900v1 [Gossypium mustelinum]|uniref:Uncharacterized protein n=1 Tax=Gossypium mustelinum TaxID=34275 RepID=A0A5D2V6D9_GOSMU|nr:hypothetical protein E1A91_D05G398900v1 [Gossypium mustelinum]
MMRTAAALSLSISTRLKPWIRRRFKPSKMSHNSASSSEQHLIFLVYCHNHDPFLCVLMNLFLFSTRPNLIFN